MSDLPASTRMESVPQHGTEPFEQRIFELSPVGAFATSVAIFLILFGAFELCALATHYPLADQLSFTPRQGAFPAAILSLLSAVALGMQRYARLKDEEDRTALERVMECPEDGNRVPPATMRAATAVGVLLGLIACLAIVPGDVRADHIPVYAWFACTMALVGALFVRGVVMTRVATRSSRDRIDRTLKVDLLRIDELAIIGRSASRAALIWLSVAAVICLFFVSGQATITVIATIVTSAAIGLWIFFRSLERVHRKIVAAKRAELDRIRHDIAAACVDAVHDPAAATRLHGLLAYETRISSVHEWPFDQFMLVRVGFYALIPAAPSIGQFALRYAATHFGL